MADGHDTATVRGFLESLAADPDGAGMRLREEALRHARIARHRFALRAEADEIAQEACCRALADGQRAMQRARPDTPLSVWIRGVVRNVAREALRAEIRGRGGGAGGVPDAVKEKVAATQRVHRLLAYPREAVRHLTEGQLTALNLHRKGLSPREIGERLGIPAESARDRVRRAWAALDAFVAGRKGFAREPLPPLPADERITDADRDLHARWTAGESIAAIGSGLRISGNAAHCRIRRLRLKLRPHRP